MLGKRKRNNDLINHGGGGDLFEGQLFGGHVRIAGRKADLIDNGGGDVFEGVQLLGGSVDNFEAQWRPKLNRNFRANRIKGGSFWSDLASPFVKIYHGDINPVDLAEGIGEAVAAPIAAPIMGAVVGTASIIHHTMTPDKVVVPAHVEEDEDGNEVKVAASEHDSEDPTVGRQVLQNVAMANAMEMGPTTGAVAATAIPLIGEVSDALVKAKPVKKAVDYFSI